MSQIAVRSYKQLVEKFELPDPEEQIMPGIIWGRFDQLFTPAYWSVQAWQNTYENTNSNYRIGNTVIEEIVACSLGGYGIPAEVGLAAFYRIRESGLVSNNSPSENEIFKILSEPLMVHERKVHYRFVNQRSKNLSLILKRLFDEEIPVTDSYAFRQWLIRLPGIGLKTASWITRNWLNSDMLAILAIHVLRAGMIMGLFYPTEYPNRNYLAMENKFITFAKNIRVQPSKLDTLIWSQMREAGKVAIRAANKVVPAFRLPAFPFRRFAKKVTRITRHVAHLIYNHPIQQFPSPYCAACSV